MVTKNNGGMGSGNVGDAGSNYANQLSVFNPMPASGLAGPTHTIGAKHFHTPLWMIKIGELLSSDVEGKEQYAQVQSHSYTASREIYGWQGNQAFVSSAMQHSDVTVRIPMGKYLPSLENTMNKGTIVDEVLLERLGNNTGDEKSVVVQIKFEKAYITAVQPMNDDILVVFSFQKKTTTFTEYKKDDASQGGNAVSEADYLLNKVGGDDAGSGGG